MNDEHLLTEETTRNAIKIRSEIKQGANLVELTLLERFSDIKVRFADTGGIVKIMLEIGEKTTHQDIRDSIPFVLGLREQLFKAQSDKIALEFLLKIEQPSNKKELLEFYSQSQEHGISYSKLAKHLNDLVASCLKKHFEIKGKNQIDMEELIALNLSMQYAATLLAAMSVKEEDIWAIISDGLERLSLGESPFPKDYPIPRYKMIEVLRTWRKNKLHIATQEAIEKARNFKSKEKGEV
ncbi:MAG: hypothetical protein ISR58_13885 [Anaerolineales bacterium]|nr:hypothetical protein [Chloroflexota bacterium]MBL6982268.1 hypothetical protein [Anaerolineales bacterium]